ncbi:MAG: alcohol dehydrogenase catalytic domain-containing protein [Tepidiformaceae bacterium]
MKAVAWNADSTVSVVERPDPTPREGWVRIRVAAAGICGTDMHFFSGGFPAPAGLVPGHEVSGTIDMCGEGVELAPGTAVAVEPLTGCGACPNCRRGDYNRCPERTLFGVTSRGGLAEYMTVPARCVYALPDGLDVKLAALVEPVAVCVRGLRLGGVTPGEDVVILGGGTIGLICVALAKAGGARRISVSARHPQQQALAEALGATFVAPDGPSLLAELGASADRVIETVGGKATTLSDSVALARPGATITMLGVFEGTARLPALDFSTRELTLVGSNCYASAGLHSDFEIAVGWLSGHTGEMEQLVTHRFSLEEAAQAFSTANDKASGAVKVHIFP